MRILALIVTVVLAQSFVSPTAWASPNDPTTKQPAKRGVKPATQSANSAQAKASSPSKAGNKLDEASLGSAARRALLKNRLQGTAKAALGKPAASKQKSKAKS